ncbi:Abi family protein [Marinoscillum sp.]|uniref:Abi family protein n=1 Tax=Marinoscillum sp. TaxID=2024838 RepID=UPI003BA9F181
MRYKEFERVMSVPRMNRYLIACNNNSRQAMTLYRLNLSLSQELFTVVSCFEIALRNAIDTHYTKVHGNDWLRNEIQLGGIFDNRGCRTTADVINESLRSLRSAYTHPKLVAELGFGFWRFMFGTNQFRSGGQTLLRIFPNKPSSTPQQQYNSSHVFNQLKQINDLRNRIAHHEPVCFQVGHPVIDTSFASQHYQIILVLFRWLGIDEKGMLYGLDHVDRVITKINSI